MASYTDAPFRKIAKDFGADLTVSEMISAHALVNNPKSAEKLLIKNQNETPYSVQINANDVHIAKEAVHILNDKEEIDIIDLNCGCPSKAVTKNGGGAALLKDLSKLSNIVEAIKITSNKPMTSVKVRLGFNEKNPLQIARACVDGGADFIVVHGRTRKQAYKGDVDYDAIAHIKQNVQVPIIANGDIDSRQKAQFVLTHTKADGVMIARSSIGKPWIFWELKNNMQITPALKYEIVLAHFDAMVRFYGNRGVILFRKIVHKYAHGMMGAGEFRKQINHQDDLNMARETIKDFFAKTCLN